MTKKISPDCPQCNIHCNTNIDPKTKQEEGQLYAAMPRRRVGREARKLGTVQTSQQAAHLLALSCCYTAEKTAIHVNRAAK